MRKEYDFKNSIKNQYVKKPNEKISMNNFLINDMLSMQKELQDKYKDKWEAFNICKCWSYYNDTHNYSLEYELIIAVY